jgi:hypothetical protein
MLITTYLHDYFILEQSDNYLAEAALDVSRPWVIGVGIVAFRTVIAFDDSEICYYLSVNS